MMDNSKKISHQLEVVDAFADRVGSRINYFSVLVGGKLIYIITLSLMLVITFAVRFLRSLFGVRDSYL